MVLQNSGRYRPEKDSQNSGSKEESSEFRVRQAIENNAVDEKYGFKRLKHHEEKTGYLINMHTTEILNEDKRLVSAVDYYFMEENAKRFKVSYIFKPYFYVLARKECIKDVSIFLAKKYPGLITALEEVSKEDLDLPNHLIGLKQQFLKLSFATVSDLVKVRTAISSSIRKNKHNEDNAHYTEMLKSTLHGNAGNSETTKKQTEQMENIIDIREYDVPYHVRVSIDRKIFVGSWYNVKDMGQNKDIVITKREDLIDRPDLIVLAFDIETTKLPLKFPDAATDQIMMISYMIDGQGFLITNREIIAAEVEDFEYNPKPEFEGFFTIFNEPDEAALLRRFFDHILEVQPHIFVTYNGDFFDWPFVETRAATYDMDMNTIIGFSKSRDGVYSCRPCIHMDCLCWVKRDSYLPVGSHNLKAVAKAKLRYDPVELDPEDMCRLAAEQPQQLSNYSVSDAVATYYLYMKYVHPFIFALCTIIPMEPDEGKGSGTLCEALLMVEAFHANIIFPNKQKTELNKMTPDGHILDQETYVGGHVEALESGVFRADIPCRFKMVPEAFNMLIGSIDNALKHAIEEEEKIPLETVTNFDEIVQDIKSKLEDLRDTPCRMENPVIYHLDVGAMYPNIILTNRLQPSAMVDETMCAACDFNRPGATCQRTMTWMWRGEVMPASRSEFQRIQQQLEMEKFPPAMPGGPPRAFHEISDEERAAIEKKRLAEYCRKVYKKAHVTKMEERHTTICQKENSFYVDTVRAFRDRRYTYKGLCKVAKKQIADAIKMGDAAEIKIAKNREVLYDSLQLAHKCILNSFYGYVMRKGARWHSMEMAGIVCYTGAHIITKAREIIEQVGRPLELDTDGIWCVLPASFPENYVVESTHPGKSKVTISYPNAVLNSMVKDNFTNDQYHELVDGRTLKYDRRSENSIFFEVDGPYLAMVLPASKEEGKRLKKRYAVFNFDGSLAELKGFEVKRRGELQLIKNFQSSVFEAFLKGDTLDKCYAAVAKVADYWLDVLYSKAADMPDTELFELISENRSMSRKLEDYGAQKSTSISTAKRLAEFLGDQMVKDAGLACKFIISRKPEGSPVTERAIPLAIFQAEPSVKRFFLRKWLKDNSLDNIDIRQVLDWDYYIERLGGAVQKIITIPAAMQGLSNPVPRVRHPDWLHKKMLEKNDTLKQRKINELFVAKPKPIETMDQDEDDDDEEVECGDIGDMEDIGGAGQAGQAGVSAKKPVAHSNKRKRADSVSQRSAAPLTWQEALGSAPAFGSTLEVECGDIGDMEDIGGAGQAGQAGVSAKKPVAHSNKRKRADSVSQRSAAPLTWQEALGSAPAFGSTLEVECGDIGDMEDIGGAGQAGQAGVSAKKPVAHSNKRKRADSVSQRSAAPLTWQEALGSAPAFGSTLKEQRAWLAFHKKKWAWQKDNMRLGDSDAPDKRFRLDGSKQMAATVGAGTRQPTGTIGSFLRKAQQTLLSQKWHIIQVVETEPGVMRAWVLAGSELHQVRVLLPRVFYVNQLTPRDECAGALWRKCNRILPRAHRAHHLYQFVVPELLYREHSVELALDLSSPDIDGIYETQMPAEFRALLALGCLCRVDRNEARRIAGSGQRENNTFTLTQLISCDPAEYSYLDKDESTVRHIYIYYQKARTGPRALIGLFISPSKKALMVALDTVRTNQMPALNNLYNTERNSRESDDAEIEEYPSELRFDVAVETSDQAGWRQVHRALQAYRDEKRGPTVILLQAHKDYDTINQLCPVMQEFPVVQLQTHDMEPFQDGLDWQRVGAKTAIKHFLNSEAGYNILVEQARYFQIPVGNIPEDQALFAIDLCFGRHLNKNNFVTWCSPTKRPDLGGRETDDQRLQTEVQEMASLENNSSGCYTSVCIQLGIDSLAVNALLQAHHITELEGTTSTTSFDCMPQLSIEEMVSGQGPILSSYDETALTSAAFRILRSMVNTWVRDVSIKRHVFADYLLMNFYRWIRSPQAFLYDPALHRTLHNLMKKLFLQLVAEFKRLGSTIIYASFNKIILCTKKNTTTDALGYMEYVVASIRNKEIFHGVQMTYQYCWENLMWLDTMNNGGIKGTLPEGLRQAGEGQLQELSQLTLSQNPDDELEGENVNSDGDPEVVMTWNLMDHLPDVLRKIKSEFIAVVISYICAIYKFLKEKSKSSNTPRMRLSGIVGPDAQTQTRGLGVGAHEEAPEFAKNLISEQLAPKLFKMTQKLNSRYPSVEVDDGIEKKTLRPALEFAKAICKVLYLDKSVNLEVEKLQANLFWLLKVGEFSEQGQWQEFFPSCVLTEVICRTCNDCRDIDLNRDLHKSVIEDKVMWLCPSCESPYDNTELESLLLDIVQRKLMAYIMQDFQCKKCHQVKDNYMKDSCSCAGEFHTVVQSDKIFKHLKTFRNIAHNSQMDVLEEAINWILDQQNSV
ncbi:DNA polymerase epsilon catalytic subunit 1 [Nilaparvata lugens]|uniref:DNA polymerase epsilon catalytic subunit 1 n=1 Tax=Nilaparvata lugens TaxID=108931 RepID=UPI00193E9CA0|nr:DNA polymerase epsilon catalytic subunit 1 [Nilaparvata lugens]